MVVMSHSTLLLQIIFSLNDIFYINDSMFRYIQFDKFQNLFRNTYYNILFEDSQQHKCAEGRNKLQYSAFKKLIYDMIFRLFRISSYFLMNHSVDSLCQFLMHLCIKYFVTIKLRKNCSCNTRLKIAQLWCIPTFQENIKYKQ